MKAKKSKGADVAEPMAKMKPHLHLDGDHAKRFAKHKVGDKVTVTGNGRIVSQSQHDHGDGPNHSVGIELDNVQAKARQPKSMLDAVSQGVEDADEE